MVHTWSAGWDFRLRRSCLWPRWRRLRCCLPAPAALVAPLLVLMWQARPALVVEAV